MTDVQTACGGVKTAIQHLRCGKALNQRLQRCALRDQTALL
ncbi:Uncharacterised protein [Vibrio cholerae]|nr:Uncharacterised protein [Vibrio cholerae]